uniref:Uncharacterized protein n=1 Tax=Solanum lycopersicum TaxID=4081 RepID=A0A3Q7GEL1_SOLLC
MYVEESYSVVRIQVVFSFFFSLARNFNCLGIEGKSRLCPFPAHFENPSSLINIIDLVLC